jgi:ABC-type multidrug transport system ATPase subunit
LKITRQKLERMSGGDLLRLARVLKIPIWERRVTKNWLIDGILSEFEDRGRLKELPLPPKLYDPAIEITHMTKKFGNTIAVNKLDLKVRPGEIVGLVGPNGAGKTTTLRVLTGIIRPTVGRVKVNGFNMKTDAVHAKQRIGYIPERPTCYPSLRVREYFSFMASIYNVPQDDAIIRISEYIEMFQLEEYMNAYIGTLSKGNLQRTLIVGIFVREPPFILALDEPIYGLDPRGAWSLKSHLKELKEQDSAILISTHILEVAEGLCDRFVIMHEGDIVGQGTLPELFNRCPGTENLEEIFLTLTGGLPED